MGPCSWLVFGGLAGWIASMFAGTNAKQGLVGNIIVGIIGAFVGGYVMSLFGKAGVQSFDLRSFAVAVGGSVATLAVKKALFGKG
jgi:uncharacterized membrane protein YeaQ/YmgE (transglycosylase-associated protein family)